ncbi:MAG: hypothetical protein ABIF88_00645 [archaeon]
MGRVINREVIYEVPGVGDVRVLESEVATLGRHNGHRTYTIYAPFYLGVLSKDTDINEAFGRAEIKIQDRFGLEYMNKSGWLRRCLMKLNTEQPTERRVSSQ